MNVKSIITSRYTGIIRKADHKPLVQAMVSVEIRKHVDHRSSAYNKCSLTLCKRNVPSKRSFRSVSANLNLLVLKTLIMTTTLSMIKNS